jgi:hypothetical protein
MCYGHVLPNANNFPNGRQPARVGQAEVLSREPEAHLPLTLIRRQSSSFACSLVDIDNLYLQA